ncbi:hypothetical protein DF152_11730 [Burkholderia cenocepacia]|nr:hypothetical protein DF152_11730 [Burkholderia cenocepacia]
MMVDFAGRLLDVSSRYLGLAIKHRTVVAHDGAGSGHATRVSDSHRGASSSRMPQHAHAATDVASPMWPARHRTGVAS